MTVIQPNKNNKNIIRLVSFLSVFIFIALSAEVMVYFQTVNLRHEARQISAAIDGLRVENAELKNSFYRITDQKNLERVAKEIGLVQDKNPKWVFASQH